MLLLLGEICLVKVDTIFLFSLGDLHQPRRGELDFSDVWTQSMRFECVIYALVKPDPSKIKRLWRGNVSIDGPYRKVYRCWVSC